MILQSELPDLTAIRHRATRTFKGFSPVIHYFWDDGSEARVKGGRTYNDAGAALLAAKTWARNERAKYGLDY